MKEQRRRRMRRRPGEALDSHRDAEALTTPRLCVPLVTRRAYATSLSPVDHVLGPRVLAQSLKAAGSEADLVVIVSASRADARTVALLENDGMHVHVVPETLSVDGREVALPPELLAKVSLWNLQEYDRVIYLDPRAIVEKNSDSLFVCDGFCAALPPAGAPSAASPLPLQANHFPETGVMALEPHQTTHAAMLSRMAANVTAAAEGGVDGFFRAFFRAGNGCPLFHELSGLGEGEDPAGMTGAVDSLAAAAAGRRRNHQGGHSVVLLNAGRVPKCAPGGGRAVDAALSGQDAETFPGPCRRLPYTYAAPSSDYDGFGKWFRPDCADCERVSAPHIIRFSPSERPWDGLSYVQRPLLWRWDRFRAQLNHSPYGDAWAPWVLFLIPCLLLLAARVHHNMTAPSSAATPCSLAGNGRSPRGNSDACDAEGGYAFGAGGCNSSGSSCGSGGGAGSTTSGETIMSDDAHVVSSSGACMGSGASRASPRGVNAHHLTSSRVQTIEVRPDELTLGSRGSLAPAPGSGSGGAACLPLRLCYVLAAVTAVMGSLWYEAALDLSIGLVHSDWHPVISVLVYNAWLCCALVLGLYLVDYAYFLVATGGRTLPKDLSLAALALVGLQLHAASRYAAAGAVCAAVILLGCAHGRRAAGARFRLSSIAHHRWLIFSCAACALLACLACSSAEASRGGGGDAGAVRRLHRVVAPAHVAFVALLYASMVGGDRLRKDIVSPHSPVGLLLAGGRRRSWPLSHAAGAASHEPGALYRLWFAMLPLLWRIGSRVSALRRLVRRRWLLFTVALLVLAARVGPRMSRPNTVYFGLFAQQCLQRPDGGFLSASGARLAASCGEMERFKPVATGRYFEAFRQYKVCLEAPGGRFLTLARGRLSSACVPENQFVFQPVRAKGPPAKTGSGMGARDDAAELRSDGVGAGDAATATDGSDPDGIEAELSAAEEFCVYNPATGLYLSGKKHPQAHCRETERWRIAPVVPQAPDARAVLDSAAAMLEPHFASRAPLTALLTYLGLAAVFLHSREWLGSPNEGHQHGGSGGWKPLQPWCLWGGVAAAAPFRKTLQSAALALANRLRALRAPMRQACDGLLLALLWILLPVHLVQVFSVLVGDHARAVSLAASHVGRTTSSGNSFGVAAGVHRNLGEMWAGESVSGPWWWPAWLEDDAAAALCGPWVGPLAALVLRWHLAAAAAAVCHVHVTMRRRRDGNTHSAGADAAIGYSANESGVGSSWASSRSGHDDLVSSDWAKAAPFGVVEAAEGLALRMRASTALSAVLCGAAAGFLPRHLLDFEGVPWGGGGCGPGWVRDNGWATVSPVLFFSVVYSTAGVYRRTCCTAAGRIVALAAAVAATAVVVAVHPRYVLPAALAGACNSVGWALTGVAALVWAKCLAKRAGARSACRSLRFVA